jgi:hypothetical protein
MVLHCADVLAFAYPSPTELPSAIDDRISKWNSLVDYTHQWLVHRPPFFAPLNQSPPSQPTFGFAMIYFHNETHILGAQHFHLSLILLALSNPHPLPHTSLSDHTSRSSLRNRLNKLDDNGANPRPCPCWYCACTFEASASDEYGEHGCGGVG